MGIVGSTVRVGDVRVEVGHAMMVVRAGSVGGASRVGCGDASNAIF